MKRILSFLNNKIVKFSLILLFTIFIIYVCLPFIMIAQYSPFENIIVRLILIFISLAYAAYYYSKKLHVNKKKKLINTPIEENHIHIKDNKKNLTQLQTKIDENFLNQIKMKIYITYLGISSLDQMIPVKLPHY